MEMLENDVNSADTVHTNKHFVVSSALTRIAFVFVFLPNIFLSERYAQLMPLVYYQTAAVFVFHDPI